MKISFAAPKLPRSGCVVVPVAEERKLLPAAARLDAESNGTLTRAMAASKFKGRGDDTLILGQRSFRKQNPMSRNRRRIALTFWKRQPYLRHLRCCGGLGRLGRLSRC